MVTNWGHRTVSDYILLCKWVCQYRPIIGNKFKCSATYKQARRNVKTFNGINSTRTNSKRISFFKEEGLATIMPQKLRANGPHGNTVPPTLSRRSAQLWLAASKLRYVVTNRNTNLNWAHIPLGHTNVSMVVTLYPCHSILLDGC